MNRDKIIETIEKVTKKDKRHLKVMFLSFIESELDFLENIPDSSQAKFLTKFDRLNELLNAYNDLKNNKETAEYPALAYIYTVLRGRS